MHMYVPILETNVATPMLITNFAKNMPKLVLKNVLFHSVKIILSLKTPPKNVVFKIIN